MNDDERLVTARGYIHGGWYTASVPSKVLADLLEFAEERLRVNVGLVAENAELRRRAGVA